MDRWNSTAWESARPTINGGNECIDTNEHEWSWGALAPQLIAILLIPARDFQSIIGWCGLVKIERLGDLGGAN